jgi:flagellar hook protein FlgE
MNFQTDGTLIGNFSNDQKVALAQLAVNQPVNEEGFSQVGNNDFATSANTGAMQVGLAGTNGLGLVRGGSLENSNVDLTNELNNMILAQKGFDSNARMFGTVNNTLQTQANLGLGS